jgi:hypothetical protein
MPRTRKSRKRGGAFNPDAPRIQVTNETIRTEVERCVKEGTMGELSQWDVSQVTDMSKLFSDISELEEVDFTGWEEVDFSGWDVSNVTNMSLMFAGCFSFNRPLVWNTGKVTEMSGMFAGCTRFNQGLDWNTENVTDMTRMFYFCTSFNRPLVWNTGKVTEMSGMFEECTELNQALTLKTDNVTTMRGMFNGCTAFNQPLSHFRIQNVTSMSGMFTGCTAFNQDLSGWVLGRNVDVQSMFEGCPIPEDFMPRRVAANDIHKASSNINYEELNDFLEGILKDAGIPTTLEAFLGRPPVNADYRPFIETTMQELIVKSGERQATRMQQLAQYGQQKLNVRYSTFSPLLIRSIYNTLTYAKIQSPPFINAYIGGILDDCFAAYAEVDARELSCPKGLFERFATGLVAGCTIELSNEDSSHKEEYTKIIELIEMTPKKIIPLAVQDWFKLKSREKYPPSSSPDIASRKADLKKYIITQLRTKLNMTANEIASNNDLLEAYMPTDDRDYYDDAFDYKGGTRKSKKSRRKTKRKR